MLGFGKQKTSLPTIVQFSEVSRDDISLVGGKGANLGELTNAGLPVPPGFIVTAEAYRQFLETNGLFQPLQQLLGDLNVEDSATLQAKAAEAQKLILSKPMPAKLNQEISKAYELLVREHPEGQFVAVRSSATAEDLPSASFAGQQATFLNVRGADAVCQSVQHCWASLFEARAIYYRVQQKIELKDVAIAVPVQAMVNSEKAGVMFTIDPVKNDKSVLVIEGALGLGEAVVSGTVTPDRFVVSKEKFDIVERQVNSQPWKIVRAEDSTGMLGTKHETIPAEQRATQKLTDDEVIALAKLGVKIEEHYQSPQDTEWAIAGGTTYIVQARPVTTLTKTVPVTNAESGESVISNPSQTGEKSESVAQDFSQARNDNTPNAKPILKGGSASMGSAFGVVRIISDPSQLDRVQKGDVLVAEMTSPDYVPAMKRASAIVTDTGGRTSHAAIVSRELSIPCVVGTGTATHVLKDGQLVTVDGTAGLVYQGKLNIPKTDITPKSDARYTREIPVTGTKVYVNLADPDLAEKIAAEPVDGVGLLRAEFMVAGIGEHPKAMEQDGRGAEYTAKLAEGLTKFAAAFDPRPIIYRATDFKTNEYRKLKGGEEFEPQEENPMLGYRGALRYRTEPKLFRRELDAIIEVRRSHPNLWLMIPFVRTTAELKEVIELVEASGLKRGPNFKIYMMCEIPANVILLDEFLDVGIDGVSIGSNDLTQLVLGVDRDNGQIAESFDERNEAVIRCVQYVIHTCRKRNVSVGICGQAPSVYPEFTEMLVNAGITSVSVNPDVIVSTRQLIASIEKRLLLKAVIDKKV